MVLAQKRPRGAPLQVLAAELRFENHRSAAHALASGQSAPGADCRGGRNARATQTHSRTFRFPPATHPRESPTAASVTARHLSASLRDFTYALKPLSVRSPRTATEKHFPLVKKLWTIGLSCGGLRKTGREIMLRRKLSQSSFMF